MLAAVSLAAAASALVIEPEAYTNGWAVGDKPSPAAPFQFRVAVKQQGINDIKRIALEVSDPTSPKYTQFLTQAEIDRITAPTTADLTTVTSWISASGCSHAASNTNMIKVTCSVADAEKLLGTEIHTVFNAESKQAVIRAVSAANVPEAVSATFGIHGLPLPPDANVAITSTLPGEPAKVTPDVIASTYSISNVTNAGGNGNAQAVAEFQGQYYSPDHLSFFFSKFVTSAPKADASVRKVYGTNEPRQPGVEAELDIQYMMGVAPGIASDFYSQKNMDFCSDLAAWTTLLLDGDDTPFVHSISYGWQGDLKQIQCKETDVTEVDNAFAKLAAKGIAIIFASGDSGSGYTTSGFGKAKLYPSWPASSPWVTAVGATRFQEQKIGNDEQATDQFGSGGGFSKLFDRTDATWQESAVKGYLAEASDLPPDTVFDKTGRATPDVSALGEGYQVITGGGGPAPRPQSVGGTSASTPAFSGIVSLLNDARLKAGKKQLGFLNPFIYQNPEAFTDVTVGTNAIGRGGEKVKYGFECAKGWDPATGLGSPIFPALLKAALAAP